MKKKLLISACLYGENCKYNGGNNKLSSINKLVSKYELIPVCPEQLGGLSTPRTPSEILGNRVINKNEEDLTDAFLNGAVKTLSIANSNACFACLMKERSPSCGVKKVYNGNFSGELIEGSGITTRLLKENGYAVFSEEEIDNLLQYIDN